MRALGAQLALPIIRSDKKTARAARRVEDDIAGLSDTKTVDDIDDIVAREMLAVAMPFFGIDQLLEYSPDDVRRDGSIIDRLDPF